MIDDGLTPDQADLSKFLSQDLAAGNYRIKEETAPDGYMRLPGYFILTISYRSAETSGGKVIPGKKRQPESRDSLLSRWLEWMTQQWTQQVTYELKTTASNY